VLTFNKFALKSNAPLIKIEPGVTPPIKLPTGNKILPSPDFISTPSTKIVSAPTYKFWNCLPGRPRLNTSSEDGIIFPVITRLPFSSNMLALPPELVGNNGTDIAINNIT
jgi:hypothetical protein